MSRVIVRELGGHHRVRLRNCCLSRRVSTAAQDAGAPKPQRRGLAGVGSVLAGVSIVGLSYYAMTWEPRPNPLPPVTVQDLPQPAPVHAPSSSVTTVVSARDELLQRMESLKAELEDLREQKRNKLIDMKKKAIKEDLKIIQSSLAALDDKQT